MYYYIIIRIILLNEKSFAYNKPNMTPHLCCISHACEKKIKFVVKKLVKAWPKVAKNRTGFSVA